jgi:hypothetical protein
MAPWANGPLFLYHGCDHLSAQAIRIASIPYRHSISLTYCKLLADFGRGFYTTTNLHQAKNWANLRCQKLQSATPPKNVHAVVIEFQVDRNLLARPEVLCFVTEGADPAKPPPPQTDYWEFVKHNRLGRGSHKPNGGNYDIVYGPVSLWPQTLVIKDCDQISFHTIQALLALPRPNIIIRGTPFIT